MICELITDFRLSKNKKIYKGLILAHGYRSFINFFFKQ